MFFHGPESSDFPATTSSVPCDWEYFGTQYDLHFHAGIIGFTQDSDTGSLESVGSRLVGYARSEFGSRIAPRLS